MQFLGVGLQYVGVVGVAGAPRCLTALQAVTPWIPCTVVSISRPCVFALMTGMGYNGLTTVGTGICVYACLRVLACVYACACVCMRVCACIFMRVRVHPCVCGCVCISGIMLLGLLSES